MVGGWSTYPISGHVDVGQVVWAPFISTTSHDGVSIARDHWSFYYLDCQVLIDWVIYSILLFWVHRWIECLYFRFCVVLVSDIGNVYTKNIPVIHVCPKSGLRSSPGYSVILIIRKSEWWEDSPPPPLFQANLELTEICLILPTVCWDQRHMLPRLLLSLNIFSTRLCAHHCKAADYQEHSIHSSGSSIHPHGSIPMWETDINLWWLFNPNCNKKKKRREIDSPVNM